MKQSRRPWTDDEIAWLVALYPDCPTRLIAETLGRAFLQSDVPALPSTPKGVTVHRLK